MERERLVNDATCETPVSTEESDRETGSDFDIDVDRAVGHEIMLDETNWI